MIDDIILRKLIDEEVMFLASKFDISTQCFSGFKPYQCSVVEQIVLWDKSSKSKAVRGKYDYENNSFEFTPETTGDLRIIGHEVAHYIHHQSNPGLYASLKKRGICREFWWGKELIELIGEYGGLVSAQNHGVKDPQSPKNFAMDFAEDFPGLNSVLYGIVSERGYKRAYQALKYHGDSLLPELSRMSLDEAEKISRIIPITFYERNILPLLDKIR